MTQETRLVLRIIHTCLHAVLGTEVVLKFFQIDSIDEQKKFYFTKIAPHVWRWPFSRTLSSRSL